MKKLTSYFTKFEMGLWLCSVAAVTVAFCLFDRGSYLTLVASVIGVTFILFNAKGNPLGQVLGIVFCFLYGVISYSYAYYGEMITYMGMSAPMDLLALISWLRNPYKGNKAEVTVNRISRKEILFMFLISVPVTIVFYYILALLGTANVVVSTFSVTTTFYAVYLTFRRSPYFSLAYATNDIVLIVLWILAAFTDRTYISVAVCFIAFLANDLYAFFNWLRMEKRQKQGK